jgi:hypothetical protein
MTGNPEQREQASSALRALNAEIQREQQRWLLKRAHEAERRTTPPDALGYDRGLKPLLAPLACNPFGDFDPRRDSARAAVEGFYVMPGEADLLRFSEPALVKAWLELQGAPALPPLLSDSFPDCTPLTVGRIRQGVVWRSTSPSYSDAYLAELIPMLEGLAAINGPVGTAARGLLISSLAQRGITEASRGRPVAAQADLERALPGMYTQAGVADATRVAALHALAVVAPSADHVQLLAYARREVAGWPTLLQQASSVQQVGGGDLWRQLRQAGISRHAAMANDPTSTQTLEALANQLGQALGPVAESLDSNARIIVPLGVARTFDALGSPREADDLRAKVALAVAANAGASDAERSLYGAVLNADLGERAEREGKMADAARENALSARYWARALRDSLVTFELGVATTRTPAQLFEDAVRMALSSGDSQAALELAELGRALSDPMRSVLSPAAPTREQLERRLQALETSALDATQGPARSTLAQAIQNARGSATQATALVSPLATANFRLETLIGHVPRAQLAELQAELDAFEDAYQRAQAQQRFERKEQLAQVQAQHADAAYHQSGNSDLPAIRERARRQDELVQLDVARAFSSPVSFHALASIGAVRAALGPRESLLAYFFGPKQLTAFVVTHGAVSAMALPNATRPLLRGWLHRAQSGDAAASSALYDALIAPLRAKLSGSTLLVVPDGLLYGVPFEALGDGKRFLFEDFEIRRLSYVSDRLTPPRATAAVSELVAAAAPDVAGMPRLLHAAAELERVKAAFPAPTLRTLNPATETELRQALSHAQVVHLAAHSELVPDNPLFSRLRLLADSANDGALEAREIADLPLSNLSLVVLSACGTGAPARSRPDAASEHADSALASAFLAAGAESVVATLWPVDDDSSGQFMALFFAALTQGATKAAALNEARTRLSRGKDPALASPGVWGAFVLLGSAAPLSLASTGAPAPRP